MERRANEKWRQARKLFDGSDSTDNVALLYSVSYKDNLPGPRSMEARIILISLAVSMRILRCP